MSGWWNGMMPAVHSRSAAATFCRTSLDSISARPAASAQVTCRSTTSTEIAPAVLNSAATTLGPVEKVSPAATAWSRPDCEPVYSRPLAKAKRLWRLGLAARSAPARHRLVRHRSRAHALQKLLSRLVAWQGQLSASVQGPICHRRIASARSLCAILPVPPHPVNANAHTSCGRIGQPMRAQPWPAKRFQRRWGLGVERRRGMGATAD
jgi:hypothetical protein